MHIQERWIRSKRTRPERTRTRLHQHTHTHTRERTSSSQATPLTSLAQRTRHRIATPLFCSSVPTCHACSRPTPSQPQPVLAHRWCACHPLSTSPKAPYLRHSTRRIWVRLLAGSVISVGLRSARVDHERVLARVTPFVCPLCPVHGIRPVCACLHGAERRVRPRASLHPPARAVLANQLGRRRRVAAA